jgi:hypothetical protein
VKLDITVYRDKTTIAEVRGRVLDGIALGGDYRAVFERYVEAHHDRAYLLKLLDDAQSRRPISKDPT